ncbi:MAG: DegT/DnrJ/EryC1/StrS family aminotransferase [Candidatus Micrarchaeia archaeon]
MAWKIPLYKIYSDSDEVTAATRVITRGMGWANGPEIQELERELASYSGRKYALAFNNGTSALHALLLAYGIGKGDEVIVPSFTFISTANSVLFTGAKPVFADIEEKTCALTVEDVKKKLTKRTKAIIPIHYAGCPAAQIKELCELAEKNGIPLLEDAAESFGAKLNGKMAGSFGDSAMFSFCANKIITGGEGGAIVTDSKEVYEKLKLTRSHGRAETENYFESTKFMDYVELGYNYRMPSIIAGVILSQLKKIGKLISMRREVARAYTEAFEGKLELLPNDDSFFNVYQMYSIRAKDRKSRDGLQSHLSKEGIMSRVYFDPAHLTHFYKNVLGYNISLPTTQAVSEKTLSIPIFSGMRKEEMETVRDSVLKFLK